MLRKQGKPRFIGLEGADLVWLIAVLSIAAVTLIMPFLARDSLAGSEAYYNLRIAKNPFVSYDELSYSGRIYILSLWPLMLYVTNLPLVFASKFLPYLFGLLSVLLFYISLGSLNLNLKTKVIASILLVISPTYLYLFSTSNSYLFPVSLSLLVFILLIKRVTAASFLLIPIPFFNTLSGVIVASLLLFYSLKERYFKLIFPTLAIILAILVKLVIYGLPETVNFKTAGSGARFFIQNFLSDLGGKFGFSIFFLVLVIFGLGYLWEKKYQNLSIYLSGLFLLAVSFYKIEALFYLIFMFSLVAAMGLIKIFNLKWDSLLIRNLSVIILTLGLLFSFANYLGVFSRLAPSESLIEGLENLREISGEDDVVFSHYSKGVWINTIAGRKNVIDSNFQYAPDVNQRYIDSNEFFYTRRVKNATTIIDKYNISYIFIDGEMKQGQVWNNEGEGLLFLFEYSKRFKNVYKKNNVEIWQVR